MNKALVLPVLLALSACGDSPAESLAKARSEYAAHDYAAARIHLAKWLVANPADREALLLQTRTLLALGDGDGAQQALSRLTGGQAPSAEVAELAAEAALLRGVPDLAVELLGQRQSAEAHRLRALAALQDNQSEAAQRHFEAALAAGGNARTYADYARYHLLAGAPAEAEAMAARAQQAAPDGIDTLLVLGQLAVRRGDLGTALSLYTRAARLYPNSLAPLTGRAGVLGDLGRIDEMAEAIDQAATIAPKHPTVLYLRTRAATARQDWRGVRALVEPLQGTLAPGDPLRVLHGEALLRLGQSEQAIAQLQTVVRAVPGHRAAIKLLGEAMLSRGDARGALATLRPLVDSPAARNDELALAAKAAQASGDPLAARYAARSQQPAVQAAGQDLADADAAMRAGNWAGAAEAYARLLKVTDGRNPLVLNNMAYAQLMLGNQGEARQFASRALKAAPDHASVLDTAGWVLFKTGADRTEALRLLRRASQLAPGNSAIRAHPAEAERARS